MLDKEFIKHDKKVLDTVPEEKLDKSEELVMSMLITMFPRDAILRVDLVAFMRTYALVKTAKDMNILRDFSFAIMDVCEEYHTMLKI